MRYKPEGPDVLGSIRWHGIEGIIIPSEEGYGVIFTADPERIVITVPYSALDAINKDTPMETAEEMLRPMFFRIGDMLSEMHEKSRGPE